MRMVLDEKRREGDGMCDVKKVKVVCII